MHAGGNTGEQVVVVQGVWHGRVRMRSQPVLPGSVSQGGSHRHPPVQLLLMRCHVPLTPVEDGTH